MNVPCSTCKKDGRVCTAQGELPNKQPREEKYRLGAIGLLRCDRNNTAADTNVPCSSCEENQDNCIPQTPPSSPSSTSSGLSSSPPTAPLQTPAPESSYARVCFQAETVARGQGRLQALVTPSSYSTVGCSDLQHASKSRKLRFTDYSDEMAGVTELINALEIDVANHGL